MFPNYLIIQILNYIIYSIYRGVYNGQHLTNLISFINHTNHESFKKLEYFLSTFIFICKDWTNNILPKLDIRLLSSNYSSISNYIYKLTANTQHSQKLFDYHLDHTSLTNENELKLIVDLKVAKSIQLFCGHLGQKVNIQIINKVIALIKNEKNTQLPISTIMLHGISDPTKLMNKIKKNFKEISHFEFFVSQTYIPLPQLYEITKLESLILNCNQRPEFLTPFFSNKFKNLKNLEISSYYNKDMFNQMKLNKTIETLSIKLYENTSIINPSKLDFQELIEFLNENSTIIKLRLDFSFKNVLDYNKSKDYSIITNQTIQKAYFISFIDNSEKELFKLWPINNIVSIKSIKYIDLFDIYRDYLPKLKKITLSYQISKEDQNAIIELNRKYLKKIYWASSFTPESLLINKYIQTIECPGLQFSQLIYILNLKHQSLISFTGELSRYDPYGEYNRDIFDIDQLTESICNNNTLTSVRLSLNLEDYEKVDINDYYESITRILNENHIISTFEMNAPEQQNLENEPIIDDDIQNSLVTSIKNNNSITSLGICLTEFIGIAINKKLIFKGYICDDKFC